MANITSLGSATFAAPSSYTQPQTPHLVTANFPTRGVSGQSHICALCSGHEHIKTMNGSMSPSWKGVCFALTRVPAPLSATILCCLLITAELIIVLPSFLPTASNIYKHVQHKANFPFISRQKLHAGIQIHLWGDNSSLHCKIGAQLLFPSSLRFTISAGIHGEDPEDKSKEAEFI